MDRAIEKKILIVDDDPAFVRLVNQTLTHEGYEVLMAYGWTW